MLKNAGYILAGCLTLASLRAAIPEFELAAIKPSPEITPDLIRSGKLRMGMTIEHGRVDISGMPLEAILEAAFRTRHITAPDSVKSGRFDIVAKMPEGATEDQIPEMLQALLADRFKLTVHRETKDQPAYALVVAKGGIKAKEVPADAEVPSLIPADLAQDKSGAPLQTQVAPLGGSLVRLTRTPDGGGVISGPKLPAIRIKAGRGLQLESPKITCAELATLLTELVGRQVVDMTETKSSYEISVDIAMEDIRGDVRPRAGEAAGQASTPSGSANPMADALVAAVQKIGLRLDSRKIPTEMIIVDHLEKTPTEN